MALGLWVGFGEQRLERPPQAQFMLYVLVPQVRERCVVILSDGLQLSKRKGGCVSQVAIRTPQSVDPPPSGGFLRESRLTHKGAMIVGAEFAGDSDAFLKAKQHSLYWELVGHIYTVARDRYLAACRLLRVETELSRAVIDKHKFDHCTLQDAHDRIAARFRFRQTHGPQLNIGEDHAKFEERLEREWRDFFADELKRLVQDDEFTRLVLTAVAYGNQDAGLTAESRLRQLLDETYAAMTAHDKPS